MSVQGLASGYTILQSLFSSTAPTAADASTSATVTPTPTLSPVDQFKSDLQALFSAVQQGDMTGAQSALQAITNDVNAAQAGGQNGYGKQASPASDFQALIDAVTSGDTTGAQAALTKLQSDMAAVGGRHHHHHGGGWWNSGASGSVSGSSVSTAVAPSTDTDGDGDGH